MTADTSNEPVMITDEIPTTESDYIIWAREHIDVNYNDSTKRSFESNVAVALLAVQEHPFFKGIDKFLETCNQEYHSTGDSNLLMGSPETTLFRKSYESALNKSFRQNIVWNKEFPKPPTGGWITPDNWFSRLNDIIRGTIVCKYIDGPQILAEKLGKYAHENVLYSRHNSQQKDEGYYAYHFYVKIPVDLNDAHMSSMPVDLDVELQLTTQLQEILYKITHRFYDQTRDRRSDDPSAWKWDVTSNRFRAGYLSHTLHLLEAIILELRNNNTNIDPKYLESENG